MVLEKLNRHVLPILQMSGLFCSVILFPKVLHYSFPCSPIEDAARIFSYHLIPLLGYEPTSESCSSHEGPFKGRSND